MTGIQPGFLIGSKLRVRSNDGPWETADLKDENLFRTTDIAIPVGLCYTLDYGLVIDARYNFSLNDIATDPDAEIRLVRDKNRKWESHYRLWPIPQSEVSKTGMSQNPGYAGS